MFLGIEIGLILTGAVVTETIFAWPGLGRVLVAAAGQRDLPVVQAGILLVALTVVVANLAVDLAHALLDPRANVLGRSVNRRRTLTPYRTAILTPCTGLFPLSEPEAAQRSEAAEGSDSGCAISGGS
jgi:hypothetical protein